MEQRASIPPGLPRSCPTISYWQDPPSFIATHRSSPLLPTAVDVVIVGSGIMGATLAHTLLSRSSPPKILMLEARTACSGATGRNGGHTKCASYRSFLDNMQCLGEEEAAKIVRLEYACMKAVHAFARKNGIDCESWEGNTVDVIYSESQWNLAKAAVGEIKRVLGQNDPAAAYQFWNSKETEAQFLTKGAVGAVTYEAGSLSGYKFVTGILDFAIKKGLNLQTETPALEIVRNDNGWTVETSRGRVTANKVILATNGYTAHLYPALQGVIVPLRGHVTAHRPGSEILSRGLHTTYSFIYADGYEYMIPRPQGSMFGGDIIIGGGLTKAAEEGLFEYGTSDDTRMDPVIVNYLRESTAGYFGTNWGSDDAEGRVRNQWSGIMGYSADGFPLIGKMPGKNGLYIGASFQGHGMVLCFLSAKALATLMDGDRKEELDSWFPKAFHITKERMDHKFLGRLHATAPQDLEVRSHG
ncbi:hypothetical protein MMC06_001441 [Schaereria dolodes]|nr:hypothetical protein [Schaereria dolodes]